MKLALASISIILALISITAVADEFGAPTKDHFSRQPSPAEQDILDRGEISDGQYVAGGITGTLLGLGIGQAIEGRYSERGWIFTVGELGSIALVGAGAGSCVGSVASGGNCGVGFALITGGYLGYLGFRIWDAIDAWVVPPEQNRQYRRVRGRLGAAASSTGFMVYPTLVNRDVGVKLRARRSKKLCQNYKNQG